MPYFWPFKDEDVKQVLQWWDDDKASALQSFFCFCSYAYAYGLIYLEDAWEVATKKKRCTAKSPFFSEIFSKRDFYDFAESMRRLNKLHLILSVDEIYDGDKGDNPSNQYMIIDKSLLKQGVARYDLVRLLDLRQTDIRKAIGYNPNVDDDDEDELPGQYLIVDDSEVTDEATELLLCFENLLLPNGTRLGDDYRNVEGIEERFWESSCFDSSLPDVNQSTAVKLFAHYMLDCHVGMKDGIDFIELLLDQLGISLDANIREKMSAILSQYPLWCNCGYSASELSLQRNE